VVYTKVTRDGIYSFPENAIKVWNPVTENEILIVHDIAVPVGDLNLKQVLAFMNKIEMLPVYRNTFDDVLNATIIGAKNLIVELSKDFAVIVKDGSDELFTGSRNKETGMYDVNLFSKESHIEIVAENVYFKLLSIIIRVWSESKLRINHKRRKRYAN